MFTGGEFIYKANICGRVTSKCNADIPPGSTPVAFAYQKNAVFGDICIASLGDLMSAAVWSTFRDRNGKKGFQIHYTGGTGGCPPPGPPSTPLRPRQRQRVRCTHRDTPTPPILSLRLRQSQGKRWRHRLCGRRRGAEITRAAGQRGHDDGRMPCRFA